MKNFLSLLFCFSFAVLTYGDDDTFEEQDFKIKISSLPASYNYPARIDSHSSRTITMIGSFIYWQVMEGGLDLGHVFTTNQYKAKEAYEVINLDFKYKPGFKLSFGIDLWHDNWTILADYTWLHFSEKKYSQRKEPLFFAEGWNYYSVPTNSSYGKWKFRYDIIDLILSRPFYLGSCLTCAPYAGIKGGVLTQYFDGKYSVSFIVADYKLFTNSQKSYLVGPTFGSDNNWIVFDYCRLIANASFSLCYQHFKNFSSINYLWWNGEKDIELMHDALQTKKIQLTPIITGAFGVGCGDYFGKFNNWHVDLSFLYEITYLFNQNYMRTLNTKLVQSTLSELHNYVYSPSYIADDLFLQGLTVSARFDF